MSGNPFRRAQGSRLPDESTFGDAQTAPDSASTIPKAKTAKKKKKVVIQTPPHSPEDRSIPQHFPNATGSPPRPALTLDEDTDSTATADSDLEEAVERTRRSQGAGSAPPTMFGGVQSGMRAPYNPFAKTLATSEAAFGLQKSQVDTTVDAQAPPKPGPGRAVMDVDAFKNMLLTGSAVPPASIPLQPQQRPQDSRSNSTDTSSVSRQSIFDSTHEAHPESPRTSMDYDHRSPRLGNDEEDADDDESQHSSLLGPQASRPIEEGPPAPPKNKYGRAMPQTVSFADFDESIPTGFSPSAPRTPPINNIQRNSILRPSLHRSPSDLNKPLPAPPAEPVSIVDEPVQTKKVQQPPPPPPVSRRQGQGAASGRPRSSSNLTQNSVQPDELPTPLEPAISPAQQPSSIPQQANDIGTKVAPAPPPSRRKQATSYARSPSTETPPQLPLPDDTTSTTTTTPVPTTTTTKPMPPPPPRRHPSKTGTPATRTPFNASRNSFHATVTPPPSSQQQAPPPTPPPRRGVAANSKRSSIDGPPHRRTSGQSFESERSVSMSSLQQVDEPGEIAGGGEVGKGVEPERDVLADLAAFQAEIDALRGVQQSGKGV